MVNYRVRQAVLAAFVLLAATAVAEETENLNSEQVGDESRLEIVIVTGVRMSEDLVIETSQVARPGLDYSDLLRLFPGGNRNANGPLTRISQNRGLFGAQNNVDIDGFGRHNSGGAWWRYSHHVPYGRIHGWPPSFYGRCENNYHYVSRYIKNIVLCLSLMGFQLTLYEVSNCKRVKY